MIGIYYDVSYGKQPQKMLIIDGSSDVAPVLENPIRWKAPKAPPYRVQEELPNLIFALLENFLPNGLSAVQKKIETSAIVNFVREFNQVSFNLGFNSRCK